jgi:hypothetical protein
VFQRLPCFLTLRHGQGNEDGDYTELMREEDVDEIEIMAELTGAGK